MGLLNALRLLIQLARRPEIAEAFLDSPAAIKRARIEAKAAEFLAQLPVFPGREEDTWNHEARIKTAVRCGRLWAEALDKACAGEDLA